MSLSELQLDAGNVRTHSSVNLGAIRHSIEEFGQVLPLVVQRDTMRVIGGNARLSVMREMGIEKCDVVVVDEDDDRAKALAVALNRTGELATWDHEKLADVIDTVDFDFEKLGWSASKRSAQNNGDIAAPCYLVEITCADERQQVAVVELLDREGLQCKPVIA